MTAQTQPPKSKLIEKAAELIYRQGWNATGINQILGDAGVPKGSFYYYFQSKEDLGVAIVKHHAQRFSESYDRTLLNRQLSGRAAIESFFREQSEYQRRFEWRFGCPVGSFSNEVAASREEKIAAACREAMSQLVEALTEAVDRGQKDSSVSKCADAPKLALITAGLWQGGLLFMKTHTSEAALQAAVDGITNVLFVSKV